MEADLYKPKDFEYDYLVEQFNAEFKLDVKRLSEIRNEYITMSYDRTMNESKMDLLQREWNVLYPEYTDPIDEMADDYFDNHKTVELPCYFLQSPKDKDTNPIVHYSLQEIMLAKLQAERDKNKGFMKAAFKAGDVDNGKRFNALQNALKVNMNSTYGASGNANFAHYDPVIAAAVTWCSRKCIGQLTETLECDYAYVDKEFLEDEYIKKQMEGFEQCNLIKIRRATPDEIANMPRRRALRRLYTDSYQIDKTKEIYRIEKSTCQVVYQDTDSNYFECPDVQRYYLGCWSPDPNVSNEEYNRTFRASPDLLYDMLSTMVCLDNFLCQLTVRIIDRRPIGLGFEGSFYVCRYQNRKKKYYGLKAADDDGNVYPPLKVPEAYDEDGILKADYDEYWKPKETCTPMSDGTFVQIDRKKIIHEHLNYLDYINGMGVKVTGVSLTRRDIYRFINFYHLEVLREDLRICRFDKETREWHGISLRTSIQDVVRRVMENFRQTYVQFMKVANFESDQLPVNDFRIDDFCKNAPNNGKDNAAKSMIARYEKRIAEIDAEIEELEAKGDQPKRIEALRAERIKFEGYIPSPGSRLFYVIVSSQKAEDAVMRGVKGTVDLADLRVSLAELDDIVVNQMGFDEIQFELGRTARGLNIEYSEWLNAKKISMLYLKHYVISLAKALVLYQLGDAYPDIGRLLDSGTLTDAEKSELVSKYQDKMADELVSLYFNGRQKRVNIKKESTPKIYVKERKNADSVIKQLAQNIAGSGKMDMKTLKANALREASLAEGKAMIINEICERVVMNRFTEPYYDPYDVHEEVYARAYAILKRTAMGDYHRIPVVAKAELEEHLERARNMNKLVTLIDEALKADSEG